MTNNNESASDEPGWPNGESQEWLDVGEPVKEIPSAHRTGHGKYAAVYAQIDLLNKDEWLPVTVGTPRQAQRLIECAKLRNYRAKKRRLTVYLAKRR